ncbi:penicillin-binding protein activator [Thermaurantiacus tibetensis]|uniref:penicillin-binding protein activator n=1 Tax=Thermaurantiacus tibetensis TaxID=2759035 RepID=UPI001F463553|nr:penicillin-binding protein activator [Thermaurantiacus tibetensis]
MATMLEGAQASVRLPGGRGAWRGLALAALAALAACAPRTPPPAPSPPPPPVVEEAPPDAPPPERRHQVAVLVPLSGANAAVGQSLANAANLALADTGRTTVRITSYDTAAPGGAAAAAGRALADGAKLILGPLLAADIPSVAAPAAQRGVAVLAFSNDAALARDNVYVLGFQPAQSIERVVAHARGRGITRFAALVPNGAYGERAAVAFTRAVQAGGGEVAAVTSFARAREQLPAAARRITAYDARVKAGTPGNPAPIGFQALLIADSGATANALVPSLAQFGARPPQVMLLGTELWAADPGLARVPAFHGALFAAVPDSRFAAFERRYRERFGSNPSRLASLAYDATLLAIGLAGRWEIGTPFPPALLRDPKGFAGVDGIFRFRDNVVERGLEVRRITPSGFVTESPAPTSF